MASATKLNSKITFSALSQSDIPVPMLRLIYEYVKHEPFKHCGTFTGCGGNPNAIAIDCEGGGNCGGGCIDCGAYKFMTCCGKECVRGSTEESEGMCDAATPEEAQMNSSITTSKWNRRKPEERYPSYHKGHRISE
eukprot:PhF_6_TR8754/c0_g2_i1/m.13795